MKKVKICKNCEFQYTGKKCLNCLEHKDAKKLEEEKDIQELRRELMFQVDNNLFIIKEHLKDLEWTINRINNLLD